MLYDFCFFTLLASNDGAISGAWTILVIVVALFIVALVLEYIRRSRALRRAMQFKQPFPETGMEEHMPDLSPAEAGLVTSVNPQRVVAVSFIGLVARNSLMVISLTPLRVKIRSKEKVSVFEEKLLESVNEDGSLDPGKVLLALDWLYLDLRNRIGRYGVKATVLYYLERVENIWKDLESAVKTGDESETLTKYLPWFFLTEDCEDRFIDLFEGSKCWSSVTDALRKARAFSERIVTKEKLLEHAAYHPEGIFSNEAYRSGIIDWATEFLVYAPGSKEVLRAGPFLSSQQDIKEAEEGREKFVKRADRIQQLLQIVKNQPRDTHGRVSMEPPHLDRDQSA